MKTPIRRTETGNKPEDDRHKNLIDDLAPLLDLPFAKGVLLQGVEVQVGTNTINHKLGRKPAGWFTTRVLLGFPGFIEVGADERVLLLSATAAATVDLWVYP